MDQALTRTRRNMIGVSAVLAAIYAFGWDFPHDVRIFGNSIQANAAAVKLIAWISLGYFVWEYLVHLKDKLTYLRKEWRDRFIEAHYRKLRSQMEEKYDAKRLRRELEKRKNKGFDSVKRVQRIHLEAAQHKLFRQDIRIQTYIRMTRNGGDSDVQIDEPDLYKAYYARSVPQFLRAWFGCVFTSSIYIEHFLPMIFPLGAVLSAAFGPFSILGVESIPIGTRGL